MSGSMDWDRIRGEVKVRKQGHTYVDDGFEKPVAGIGTGARGDQPHEESPKTRYSRKRVLLYAIDCIISKSRVTGVNWHLVEPEVTREVTKSGGLIEWAKRQPDFDALLQKREQLAVERAAERDRERAKELSFAVTHKKRKKKGAEQRKKTRQNLQARAKKRRRREREWPDYL